jgi:nucleoside-diphosphate-sugar epimerase
MMKTLIIGNTGFLGHHTVLELLNKGHEVTGVSLTPLPGEIPEKPQVRQVLADLNLLTDDELLALLEGMEGLVFAAGADDRTIPNSPAYPFFHKANVESTRRLIRLARQAGIKKAVVFSSYFVYFARNLPDMKLGEKHPYIRSRLAQIDAALEEAGDDLSVSFLLLPYIFGTLPGKMPLWKPLIDYLDSWSPWVFYPAGGTAMVSVEEVATAAVAALERGEAGMEYPIVSNNLSWMEFIDRIQGYLGNHKRVFTLPNWLDRVGARFLEGNLKSKGKESGLNPVSFIDLQTRLTYLDTEYSSGLLGYQHGNFEPALKDTVEVCARE